MSTDIEILCSCGVCSMRRSIVWLHGTRYYNMFYGITVFTSSFGTIPDVVVMWYCSCSCLLNAKQ